MMAVGEMIDQPIQTLVELVRQHRLDPWDIDLQKITSLYMQLVSEMREPDLRASGRAVLSAAILLRIKSTLSGDGNGNGQAVTEEELLDLVNVDFPDIGEVTIIQNTPRKITLDDLLGALHEALAEIPEKKLQKSRRMEKIVQILNEYEVNIEKHIEELYARISRAVSSGETPTLQSLAGERTRKAVAWTFFLLLFLCTGGRVRLSQPEPFGDIAVSILG